ncbi:MAG: esterase [Bacteroidales bacterium]|nr:esterase [Bacteroidales bacterium]
MEKTLVTIGGRECVIFATESGSETLLVQPVDNRDLDGMDRELDIIQQNTKSPFQMVAFKVNDWQSELTPWASPAVFGKVPFGNKAAETLSFVVNDLLPAFRYKQVFLGGYSLAGLFALWAAYNVDVFKGVAAASPSVWYPGWIDFAANGAPKTEAVYLSLGDKEHCTKNPVMARVADCINREYQLLEHQSVTTILEWNEGNHFRDADVRMAKGFAWVVDNANK